MGHKKMTTLFNYFQQYGCFRGYPIPCRPESINFWVIGMHSWLAKQEHPLQGYHDKVQELISPSYGYSQLSPSQYTWLMILPQVMPINIPEVLHSPCAPNTPLELSITFSHLALWDWAFLLYLFIFHNISYWMVSIQSKDWLFKIQKLPSWTYVMLYKLSQIFFLILMFYLSSHTINWEVSLRWIDYILKWKKMIYFLENLMWEIHA